MNTQPEALRLAAVLEDIANHGSDSGKQKAAAELRRLFHNNKVLLDALWKACGDDGWAVSNTIESQGELK
jgi:hypothetical protein